MDIFFSLIILVAIYIACSCLLFQKNIVVPPVPVLPWVKNKAIKIALKHSDKDASYKIADLGSGWGGVLKLLSRSYKNSTIHGYELSPWPYRVARIRAWLNGKGFTVDKKSFLTEDLSAYDILYCYLHPKLMKDLVPQFKTLKSGSLIISCSFEIPEWQPLETSSVKGVVDIPIYIYKV